MKRDSEGNFKGEKALNDDFWKRINTMKTTYVFQHFDSERNSYVPYFKILDLFKHEISEAKKQSDYFEVSLFTMPDAPPYDMHIRYYNWLLDLRLTHFKEVFEEKSFVHGVFPTHAFFKLILPKNLYGEIMKVINKNNLLHIRDLIFEIIAFAQKIYINEIVFWERPEMQKIIKTAKSEANKLIKVIEKVDVGTPFEKRHQDEIKYINFVFAKSAYKISHPWLADEAIRGIRNYFDGLAFKNWRIDLERYHLRYEEDKLKGQFKFRLAKSLYNLLAGPEFFNVATKRYPNELMLCIGKIMQFCLISIGGDGEPDSMIIKNVRNWVGRNEIKETVTYEHMPPNRERLSKYFESDFIDMVSDTKRADAIAVGMYVGRRFCIDADHLADLIHLIQGIKQLNFAIGHQMSVEGIPDERWFDEFSNFNKLIQGARRDRKITRMRFTLEGEDKELELSSALPLHLIQKAIWHYSKEHEIEFDSDLVATVIIKDDDGKIGWKRGTRFNEPSQRFAIKFVKSLYSYLLQEQPPSESEFSPSDRYYRIIGAILQESWFFKHKMHNEEFIYKKVKEWHSYPDE